MSSTLLPPGVPLNLPPFYRDDFAPAVHINVSVNIRTAAAIITAGKEARKCRLRPGDWCLRELLLRRLPTPPVVCLARSGGEC